MEVICDEHMSNAGNQEKHVCQCQEQAYPSKVTWQVYMKFSSAGATVDLKPLVLPAHTGLNTAVRVVLLYGSMMPDSGVTSNILVPDELIC